MKSIKTKLALFVSCLCIVLILLVWLLTVALFESNYTRSIRKELSTQIASVAAVLESEDARDASLGELFQQIQPLVKTGVCVDVSATDACIARRGYLSSGGLPLNRLPRPLCAGGHRRRLPAAPLLLPGLLGRAAGVGTPAT